MQGQSKRISVHFGNLLTTDLKSFSTALKSMSKPLYQNNNRLINELVSLTDQRVLDFLNHLLPHLLHTTQYKLLSQKILNILGKIIILLNMIMENPKKNVQRNEKFKTNNFTYNKSYEFVMNMLIDIICSLKSQKQPDILRIIQTTFSLINKNLLGCMQCHLLVRLYAISFGCCQTPTIIQNIAVSALSALTENLFSMDRFQDQRQILESFLQYLFEDKKFSWIISPIFKGLVWDLITVAIRHMSLQHLAKIQEQSKIRKHLKIMYQMSAQYSLSNTNIEKSVLEVSLSNDSIQFEDKKIFQNKSSSINFMKGSIPEFLRYFKTFIHFTIHLWAKFLQTQFEPIVSFREYLSDLSVVWESQRNSRTYIFLQGIYALLQQKYNIPLIQEKGYMLLQVLYKISQQLCLCNEQVFVNWEHNNLYFQKMCGEFTYLSQGDFARIIRSTMLMFRIKFQQQNVNYGILDKSSGSYPSPRSPLIEEIVMKEKQKELVGVNQRWEKMTRKIIRIIRYLSSIKYKTLQQEPSRKILLQLQYWFLLCPTSKIRNQILMQLLLTTKTMQTRSQAIKASQCAQIGSNIVYGYYSKLNSTGITLIIKMLAGVYSDWQDGKGFQQLQQVSNMAVQLFKQKTISLNSTSFSKTIQAFVQCLNGLIADLQNPSEKFIPNNIHRNKHKRMINFVLQKLTLLIIKYNYFAEKQWDFITAFFITLCSNKNIQVQIQGLTYAGQIVRSLLKDVADRSNSSSHEISTNSEQQQKKQKKKVHIKDDIQPQFLMKQGQILSLYVQLTKCPIQHVQAELVQQLKSMLHLIKSQEAIMEGFKMVRNLSDKTQISQHVHELQQILIKDCLFRIKELKYLKFIVQNFGVYSSDKNESYKLISLLWTIADHFRAIKQQIKPQQYQHYMGLWQALFEKLKMLTKQSLQPEFKQSTIHAITQIIAENIETLGKQFIIKVIKTIYLQMLLNLLDIPRTKIQNQQRAEMAKSGVKNYLKMVRKLIVQKIVVQESQCIFNEIVQNFMLHVQKYDDQQMSTQYIYQVCLMLEQMLEEPLNKPFYNKNIVINLLTSIGISIKRFDLKNLHFKRKLNPLYEELCTKWNVEK